MKPLLIFDGDCGFCRCWIQRWQALTGETVDYAPYQEVANLFPQISPADFQRSVQLVDSDQKIYSGAEAVFRTLACRKDRAWLLGIYQHFPGFKFFSEIFYKIVARNRGFFSNLTRICWGDDIEPPTYLLSRWLFLRFLGVIFFVAFVSLGIQVLPLLGSNGIMPVDAFLKSISQSYGPERFYLIPSLFWLNSSDFFIQFLCWAGAGLSIFLILDIAPVLTLILLWLFYLSLVTTGHDFLAFQWDNLLLETSFLAIFFAPWKIFPNRSDRNSPPSSVIHFLLIWLLFRLIFSSGVVKLASGDPTWRNLTALVYHYETQPLPTWTSWYMNLLPEWFQKISCLFMFAIELLVPIFFFAPRRIRHLACLAAVLLQSLILVTGNYCFFNYLSIALCLLLLEDSFWPESWIKQIVGAQLIAPSKGVMSATHSWQTRRRVSGGNHAPTKNWPSAILFPVVFIILFITIQHMIGFLGVRIRLPMPVRKFERAVESLRSINQYGLFAVMTTSRDEIIIEGSNNQEEWLAYEFKYKPGDVNRKPIFVAPHQPRLDWQMWFAALGNYQQNPWFVNFCIRLLQGSPEALRLIEKNPFPEAPPKYLRAALYDYHFTDWKTRKKTGAWWTRERRGLYMPVISLK